VISWADVVLEDGADKRIHKFLSTLSRYPSFLLLEICRRDIQRVGTLKALLVHIWDRILPEEAPISSVSSSDHPISAGLSPISRNDFEEGAFSVLLQRLLYHCRRIWPSATATVAHLMSSYIDTLQIDGTHGVKVPKPAMYRRMCSLQNELLQYLALPAAIEPYLSMDYNWSAQKVILGLSSKFDPPLTLDQYAYQAVIQVLSASKKSPSEYRSATLRARTWPPWRIDQNGMDAQRELDEDMSRSIAALMRKRESGYADVPHDQVMSILGGQEPDGTPTIQTRTLTNIRYYPDKGSRLHPDIWAARVRATRDVQEAWGAFTAFTKQGGQPNLSMYLAMFQKLAYERKRLATGNEHFGAPGDGPEVFPVPDDNISEFYRSRLQPPSQEELYSKMVESGLSPSGPCLSFLVRRAPTIGDALRYLIDSGLREGALQYLHGGHPQSLPPLDVRSHVRDSWSEVVPPRITNDFIILLCRFAPRATKIPRFELRYPQPRVRNTSDMVWISRNMTNQHRHPIYRRPLQHAAYLLKVSGTKERIAWYTLWKALSQRNVVLLPSLVEDPKNSEIAWRIAARSLQEFLRLGLELDPHGFLYICEIFIKYAKVSHMIRGGHHPEKIREATDIIKNEFKKLTVCNEDSPHHLPRFMHSVHGVHMHAFFRSMAVIEDHAEILSMLEWMVLNVTELEAISNRSANGMRLTRRTLVAIRVFCEGTHVEEKARTLIESVESWDGWPTDEEVTTYQMDYELNHVDESLAECSDDETLEDDADQLDRDVEDETEDFFQHQLVINRYYSHS
jgi:hypothetical protein